MQVPVFPHFAVPVLEETWPEAALLELDRTLPECAEVSSEAEISSHVCESFFMSPENSLECEQPIRRIYRSLGLAVDGLLELALDSTRQVRHGSVHHPSKQVCDPDLTPVSVPCFLRRTTGRTSGWMEWFDDLQLMGEGPAAPRCSAGHRTCRARRNIVTLPGGSGFSCSHLLWALGDRNSILGATHLPHMSF